MANFGPPGGGAPEPWGGRRPADPYAPDPRHSPGYAEPNPRYAEPTRPYTETNPPKRGKGPLVAVLVVLMLLGLGGAGAFWFFGRDEPAAPGGTGTPASSNTDASPPASEPADAAATEPASTPSTDSRFVKAGQCLRDEGAADQPKLVISECGAKTYQVLRRIDGATSGRKDAEAKCAKVDGYTDWYFFDSELDSLDFVLCLKKR
ncbi:hypothetical protein ABZ671_23925 [Micromonospora sp. NPDC006766]|uniref:LppU/SCO3897 family protein n=1 Tax=Micromonospora sp. NPDC006766 TaxID=3154778 RepID=UPI0033EACF37